MKLSTCTILVALTCLVAPRDASAQSRPFGIENFNLTVGVRGWLANYSTWVALKGNEVCGILGATDCGFPDASSTFSAENKPVILIPSLALRWNSWLLSGSYASAPLYRFSVLNQTFELKRRESDFSVGYFVTPSVLVTLGHKSMRWRADAETYDNSGTTLGMSASARLTDRISLYGNLAYGLPGYFNARISDNVADASGRTKFDMDYHVVEVGFAFPLNLDPGGSSRPVVLTAGFRSQVATVKQYRFAVTPQASYSNSLSDVSHGFVLGLSTTF